ncbi:hypothetical protein RTBOTA2_005672 [Rhodotorula toruloides]|nr:hypothetical protein RTBOTA2_005672 [Rhodotorula toruloides]
MSYTIFGKKMYVFCCCDMLAEGPLRNRRRLADLAPPLSSSTSLALPAPLERHPASGHLSNSVFALSPAVLASFALNEYIALGTYGLVGLGAWAATRGGSDAKKADDSKLDITSQTDDKEMIAFIENFINNEEHKAKSAGGH